MLYRTLSALAVACALVPASLSAQDKPQRGPSTPEERQQALAYIAHFESDPLNPDVKSEIAWVTEWMIEVPDIYGNICLFVDLPKKDKKHSQILFDAMFLAQTRWSILHKDDPPDNNGEWLAGTEGMLRAYEKVIAAFPRDRLPQLDDLLQRRAAGTLDDWVKQNAGEHCKTQR